MTRGHRGGVRSHDAGLWRADAGRVPKSCRPPSCRARPPALRGSSLIVNLPGKPKIDPRVPGCGLPAIPYCIDLMEGPYLECDEAIIKPFRLKK